MKINLIVIDDAIFIREIIRQIVEKDDEIELIGEAEDGLQGVKLVLEKKPHVVLMDIVMPQKSGIEATKEILKKRPETKIIACSTLDQDNMIQQATEAGCCDYVVKPFNPTQIIESVKKSMERKS